MDGLEYLTESPVNAAVPLARLDGSPLPQDQVYLRNSFPTPAPGEVTGEIKVVLPGQESWRLAPDRLAGMEQVELDMVLECAGNGRSLMRPLVDGLAWGLGGVSPIRVGGVRLAEAIGDLPVLGWIPHRSTLDQMIGSAWDWMRSHPNGYEATG